MLYCIYRATDAFGLWEAVSTRFVVLTGLSGAGKTQALHALEDIGYYCVDNLPPMLLQPMVELCQRSDSGIGRVAAVVDSRGGVLFGGVERALDNLRQVPGIDIEIVFLDTTDEELARRYNETRRAHPFGRSQIIADTIHKERMTLAPLRAQANRVIDTTRMLTRELREAIVRMFGEAEDEMLSVTVLSFGFKRGSPQDADIVLDVRFLPNPFYIASMRPMTGQDQPVREYIHSFPETREFLDKTTDLLRFLLPLYVREGKTRLVIGIGCTGGQHRSVLLAEEIGEAIGAMEYNVNIMHRDLLSL